MTASALNSEVDRCFMAGMDEFVANPFITEDLLMKMAKLMQNPVT